jgi:lysine-N-methylase
METPEVIIVPDVAANSPSCSASTSANEQDVVALTSPTYAAAFRCIGASCEAHCCGEWNIPVDRNTYERYRQFPREKLGSLVSQFVILNSPGQPEGLFATINLQTTSGLCPFFGEDNLCGIQKEYGPQLLSSTCSIYPRSLSQVAGKLEGSLSLSCPEAARNVLLDPDFVQIEGNLLSCDFRTDNIYHLASDQSGGLHKPVGLFSAIRQLLIGMVRDRSRPIWHRLLLIGFLCKRLDDIVAEDGEGSFPRILRAYYRINEDDVVRTEFEAMPSQPRLKLEVIFALTDARVQDTSGNRFRDTFCTFVEGIASCEGAQPEDDIDRFLRAEEQYYRPFFDRFPFVLENYLLNYMFQNLFPFGRAGSPDFAPLNMFGEYIRMTTQFAWINALLVGIAGCYKEAFAGEHVVHTVQSFTRAVEHYPDVLKSIDEYMRIRGLDNLQGMAIMLKN